MRHGKHSRPGQPMPRLDNEKHFVVAEKLRPRAVEQPS